MITQLASTGGFRLGLDWSRPAENIDMQCAVQALECEFDREDGALRTVPGVRTVFEAGIEVESLYYDVYRRKWYYSNNRDLYTTDLITSEKIGTLTGSRKPVYYSYGGDILIASGGKLQAISGAGEVSIIDSPDCDFVSSNAGSVLISSIYGHRITWSAIGDYNSWVTDNNDASSAQYVEVGYKDKGNIVAVDFLSQSIIVYKEYGRVYQVIGNPHDKTLSVLPLSQTGFCAGSALSIDDRSYYVGEVGLMSFTPTNTYANIQPFETGLNINAWLLKEVTTSCEMWHVPNRKQIWIKPKAGEQIVLYHYIPRYSDGRGVFTSRTLVFDLHEVVSHDDDVYLAYGTKIAILDEELNTDNGKQIQTSIIGCNRLATGLFILLLSYNFVSHNIIPGYGSIQISNKTPKAVTFDSQETKLYDANMDLNTYDIKMHAGEYTKVFKVGGGPNRNVQVKILVQKGAISLRQFDYNYQEV